MHPIAFGLKRAFHATLALTRRPLRALGITAARLDMLHAIKTAGLYGVHQSALRDALGVTAATISRMLRSLEELQYVTRERSKTDARQLIVQITALGRFILRRAFARLSRNVDLAFDCALAGDRWWDFDGAVFQQTDCAEQHLFDVRRTFGDLATMHYAWHPDD